MHFIKHRDWWNDLGHANALDEVEAILGHSVPWVHGIAEEYGGRLAQAWVANLSKLALLNGHS